MGLGWGALPWGGEDCYKYCLVYHSEEETKEKSPMLELSCICQDDCCVVLVISHFTIKLNFLLSEIGISSFLQLCAAHSQYVFIPFLLKKPKVPEASHS
jgi:hypothetical protein